MHTSLHYCCAYAKLGSILARIVIQVSICTRFMKYFMRGLFYYRVQQRKDEDGHVPVPDCEGDLKPRHFVCYFSFARNNLEHRLEKF